MRFLSTILLAVVLVAQVHPADGADYAKAFDQLWSEMDRHYSYFQLRKTDWPALKTKYRPQAEAAKTNKDFVGVLKTMLAELKDQHTWIEAPGGRVFPYEQPWQSNWSIPGIQSNVDRTGMGGMVGKFASVGKLKSGHGMLFVQNQQEASPDLVQQAVGKLQAMRDAPGFIIDLRAALGGNEAHCQPLASAFCAKDVVYAQHKFRNGPGHGDFGPVGKRTLPADRNPITKPVVVLIGPATMSSGEGLALMFAALPNATLVGSPTRGSSGNPMPIELKDVGVKVAFSRWVAMLPDGTTLEGRGVTPHVEAKFPPADFGAKDPVLEKGLEVLKEKTK